MFPHSQRKPQQKPSPGVFGEFLAKIRQVAPAGGIGFIPLRVRPGAVALPGSKPLAVKACSITCYVEQSLAQVKHALHTEAEFADGAGVAGLAVDAERTEGVGVASLELAVVEEPEAGSLQQGMRRVREARTVSEDQRASLGVVGVLHQFLEDREAVIEPLAQVPPDQRYIVGRESLHHRRILRVRTEELL